MSLSAENFRSGGGGEYFSVSLVLGIGKVWIRGAGEYQNFPSNAFRLTVPKISLGQSFTVAVFLGVEKVWIRGKMEYQDFSSKFFCLTVPKISVGESFTVATISGIGKVWMRRGIEYHDFASKFLCHCLEIFHWKFSLVFQKNSFTENFYAKEGGGMTVLSEFFVS